jgi:molecular chaperone DnaK
LGEAIYKTQASDSEEDQDGARPVDDDIVDADFEDLDDDRKRG